MKWQRLFILLLSVAVAAPTVRAGILFGKKKPPVDPAQRVPELLDLVKNSPDESKRANAADEMRKYEPAAFPEMIPTLLDVLQNDPKSSVRLQAVSTLAKFRPVSQEIGMALEQTVSKDSSMRVRLHARSSLLQYHWAGYHTPKNPTTPTTKEPPLAQPLPAPQYVAPTPLPPPVIRTPPVVPPVIHTTPMSSGGGGAQRMPMGPAEPEPTPGTRPVLVPTSNPNLQPTPSQTRASDGPDLGSPN